MALKILYVGHRNTLATLEADGFTYDNYATAFQKKNTTLSTDTPKGVLGGSVAAIVGNYTVGKGGAGRVSVGIFINDAAGGAYENSPAVASGKAPYVMAQGSYEVDVYETRNAADTADLTYTVGENLYSSEQGLLTNEPLGSEPAIAVVTKVPSAADPWLGFNLLI